jgi:hypothetical protein
VKWEDGQAAAGLWKGFQALVAHQAPWCSSGMPGCSAAAPVLGMAAVIEPAESCVEEACRMQLQCQR